MNCIICGEEIRTDLDNCYEITLGILRPIRSFPGMVGFAAAGWTAAEYVHYACLNEAMLAMRNEK